MIRTQRFLLEFLRAAFAGKALYQAILKWIGIGFLLFWAVKATDPCVMAIGANTVWQSTVGTSTAILLGTVWLAIALAIAWSRYRYPIFHIDDQFENLPNTGWSASLRVLGVKISNEGIGKSEAHIHIDKLFKPDGTAISFPLPQEMSWLSHSDVPKLSRGLPAYAKIFEIEPFASTIHYLKLCTKQNSLALTPINWGGGWWRFWVHLLVTDADVTRADKWFLIEVDQNLGFIAKPGKPPFLTGSVTVISKIKAKIEREYTRINAEIPKFLKRKRRG